MIYIFMPIWLNIEWNDAVNWIENMCYDYYDKKTDDNEKSLWIRKNVVQDIVVNMIVLIVIENNHER